MSSNEEIQRQAFIAARDRACDAVDKATAALVQIGKRSIRTCVTCQFFDFKKEVCMHEMAGGTRPPARIIAFGCGYYEETVPF